MAFSIPFLLDGGQQDAGTYDFTPTHVTGRTVQSQAGPSRYTALASPDNSIWVYPQNPNEGSHSTSRGESSKIPHILATEATPAGTPTERPGNPRLSSFTHRSRAPSIASSTRTSSSRHRVTSFSPPSTAQAVLTSLSPTTATAAAHDHHGRTNSISERAELIEHLREQARSSQDGHTRSSIGLGINIGRKVDVRGQADLGRESGSTSPRSITSGDSQTTTIGGRLMEWATGAEKDEEKHKRELSEQVAEIAVEREMQKEAAEETRQEEEKKIIDSAVARSSPRKKTQGEQDQAMVQRELPVRRIVLRNPGKGSIVCLKVMEEPSMLCILRDTGLLDIFDTDTLAEIASLDLEEPEQRASSSKTPLRLSPFWQWKDLHAVPEPRTLSDLGSAPQGHILFAEGLPWSCGMPSQNGDVTRLIVMSVSSDMVKIENRLELPGQGGIGICCPDEEAYLIHCTSSSLTSYAVKTRSNTPTNQPNRPSTPVQKAQIRAVSSADPSPRPSHTSGKLEVEQPLLQNRRSFASLRDAQDSSSTDQKGFAKFLAAKKADWRGDRKPDETIAATPKIELGEGKEVERDGGGRWRHFVLLASGLGVGLVDDAVEMFHCDGTILRMKDTITLPHDVPAVKVLLNNEAASIGVVMKDRVFIHAIDLSHIDRLISPTPRAQLSTDGPVAYMSHQHIITSGREGIRRMSLIQESPDAEIVVKRVEHTQNARNRVQTPATVDKVWTADPAGNVTRRSLSDIMTHSTASSDESLSMDRLDAPVTCLRTLGSKMRYLVAGDDDGAVRIWDENDGTLQGAWTMFADPVESIALIDKTNAGPLQDHILCTSREGTVGIISLADMEHLYLIPASRAPLRRVFIGGKDILLAYANGKARVWNVETMEFRRSTGIDAAAEMLQTSSWSEVFAGNETPGVGSLTSAFFAVPPDSDLGSVTSIDPAKALADTKALPSQRALDVYRGLLPIFLPFGRNEEIDKVCSDRLAIPKPTTLPVLGVTQSSGSIKLTYASRDSVWHLTPEETGLRQLLIVSLLLPFLEHEEYERHAAEVIAYYTASLPESTVHAGTDYFASFYLHPTAEIQQAARMLFDSSLDRMAEAELQALIDQHQPHLTSTDKILAGHALLIVGAVSLHKYQSVNPSALKAASEAILRNLRDPTSPHIALAIELCSRGFATWQTYVDPMELLRQLFHLSTRKDSSSASAHARLAVLHVASSNPALFMSTLSMDILDAKTSEGRTSIMKLCVYMARKKPEVLENGLPRIAEAVVKSLDPNIAKMRDEVWQAATVILNELVLAFTTIDFHSGTQKLAVGTREGAVIMYELKTASRLYVLEPHHAPVSSVTFSPDGRRLLTVSLEEGSVTIWKIGSSLSGFFNVGGPPRQGALGGSGPFKRIEFARVEDTPLKSTGALSDVRVSWPGPRQAKVEIGETAMSFET